MNVTGLSEVEARKECERLARSTVPQIFAERVREASNSVALRYKELGIYKELTWSEYYELVLNAAASLLLLGLAPGGRVAIMADPRVEYLLAHLGALLIGAIPYGIYPTSSSHEIGFLLEHGGARIVIAGDQEHLDKLLAAECGIGRRILDHVVLIDDRTQFLCDDPRLISFTEFGNRAAGDSALRARVETHMAEVTPDSNVGLIFTSGTTGNPKGAFYTHAGMMVGLGFGLLEVMPDLRQRPHRVVTHLPLAHGMGQGLSLYVPLFADVIQHFPERGQPLAAMMKEVRPTHLLGVPRIWQKIAAELSVQIEHSGWARRTLFAAAERVGRRRARRLCRAANARAARFFEPLWHLAHRAMIWPALYKLGLAHLRGAASGGAPIPATIVEKWQSWGIPLRNIYGSTEGGMMGSPSRLWAEPDAPFVPIFPRTIEFAPDGELLIRGMGVFAGYWRDEAATVAAFDPQGRVKTGDIAEILDHGCYRVVDRKKDILITSGGKNISPAAVESALKASPYISEAVIFGDGRKYLTALIEVNFDVLANWARAHDVQYTGFATLIRHPAVLSLLNREVERANNLLARPEQVKYFRIIPKELDPEEGDTTATRKIKRKHAYTMFKELVDEMYVAN
jgi:long-chain acyl-CoA synthetase